MSIPLTRSGFIIAAAVLLAGCALPQRIPDDGNAPPQAPVATRAAVPAAVAIPSEQHPPSKPETAATVTTNVPATKGITPGQLQSTAQPSVTTPVLTTPSSPPLQTPSSMLPHLPQIPASDSAASTRQSLHQVDGLPLPQLRQLPQQDGSQPDTAATTPVRQASAVETAMAAPATSSESARSAAQAALSDLNNRANLSDAQFAIVNSAQKALAAGNAARAARLAVPLDRDVRHALQSYKVSSGETLRQIASKPSVYGNGYLWPLIWNANRAALPDPSRLSNNLVLQIRPYPTLDETAAALDYSHRHDLSGAPGGP